MKKILIADDSLFMRKVLTDILNNAGYHDIITSSDGEEAIKKYNEEKPDLVLLDIIMEKKNGLQVLQKIREQDLNANVIMITSVGQEEALSNAMAIGITD